MSDKAAEMRIRASCGRGRWATDRPTEESELIWWCGGAMKLRGTNSLICSAEAAVDAWLALAALGTSRGNDGKL